MDDAMRDLEQLRERGDEQRGRKLGLLLLASSLSVAAVFALSLAMGRRVDDEGDQADALTELVLTGRGKAASPGAAAAGEPGGDDIAPETLSFPRTLSEREDPMLEATLRAARAERAALAGEPDKPVTSDTLPAARLAQDDVARLSRVAEHDALVAQAMPREASTGGRVAAGAEGAFVLHVVSFEDRGEADRFADALRARQHRAFVAQADVPGRGRYYRVRIGPFSTKREAESYQQSFESVEHMHTIVVGSANK
jgi:DedD protein